MGKPEYLGARERVNRPKYGVNAVIWTRVTHHCATHVPLNPLGCLLWMGSGDTHTPPGREWPCDGSALLRPLNWRTRTIKRTRFKLGVSPRGGSREGGADPLFLDQTDEKFETPPPPLISGSGWPLPPYLKVWIRHCRLLKKQIDTPQRFIVFFFFTRKVSTVIFYWRRLSPLPSAKWLNF